MSNEPSLTGKQIIYTLEKVGFTIERQRGSHFFLKHTDGRTTVVPVHNNETYR